MSYGTEACVRPVADDKSQCTYWCWGLLWGGGRLERGAREYQTNILGRSSRSVGAGGSSVCDQPIGYTSRHRNRKLGRHDLLTKSVQPHQACHTKMEARSHQYLETSAQPSHSTTTTRPVCVSIVTDKPWQPTKRDGVIFSPDVAVSLVSTEKRILEHDASYSRFWRRHYSDHDQGEFHPLRQRDVPGSNTSRTNWAVNRIAWTSECSASMSVAPLGRGGRDQRVREQRFRKYK